MMALSASNIKTLLGWIVKSTVCDSELSVLQSNQKASGAVTSFGGFDVQQTSSKTCITYLAARGPRAEVE